ncbi:serine/threonine protein phosphatase [Vandammella animalimorsus]|uniref:Serine/threonine protein phosphatase n=1 Tax=Vandammella animalimorsus TaxID=2029117 RepID=A0A2A2T3L2_9BURK|nr:protein phosphatase 2C domain-containing protein [Vandammella animalimorsus]PAT31224.1 serine/threonine protein phosphatase [Vandammella animalimorsus]PAX16083.1 serine/threonine protein phosphatase [Vandammella animalimorsus]PAX20223.1 serine/threonine protein phosphatase [Vandammella animalimorsus]RRD67174.1 serine/threonine-protein phosphatase [Comamonadaceae bacterium OH2310_COT-174]
MPTNYRLTAATGLHKGDRQYQQDQVAIYQHHRSKECVLGIVADGMGGRSGGRKAADQVLLTARQLFERFDPETDKPEQLLHSIVKDAHLVIRLTAVSAEQEPHSTIAAFLITPQNQCHWIHAGDSRIYYFQWGRLVFRTKDHSYVQSLIDSGEISEEEATNHPNSNVLVGCLGSDIDPPATAYSIAKLEVGDVLLACSDGLWSQFTPQELGQTTQMLNARDAAMFLVNKANERAGGSSDNISVAIIKIEPLPAEQPQETLEQRTGFSTDISV